MQDTDVLGVAAVGEAALAWPATDIPFLGDAGTGVLCQGPHTASAAPGRCSVGSRLSCFPEVEASIRAARSVWALLASPGACSGHRARRSLVLGAHSSSKKQLSSRMLLSPLSLQGPSSALPKHQNTGAKHFPFFSFASIAAWIYER